MSLRILATLLVFVFGATVSAQAPAAMPPITSVGHGIVWRVSNKDAKGDVTAPWKEIAVTNVFGFKQKPIIGSKVTIVPLNVALAPFDLKIISLKERKECDESLPAWWEVDLEPITARNIFEIAPAANRSAEYPFDVGVIHPAVSFARQIPQRELTKAMLPSGVALATVKAAIDLTNDRKPEVLIIEYCCDNPKKSSPACDYFCSKTFKRVGRSWRLIDTSAPC